MVSVCGFTIQYSGTLALGIVAPLLNQIAFRLLFAHHFQGEVGAQPEPVLPTRIGGGKQQQKIGLTELARPDLQPQRGEMDLATAGLRETDKGEEQELQHALVLVRGHGEDFQEAVGELDQPVAVVGQDEILVLAPSTLGRKYFLEHVLPLLVPTEGRS